MSRQGKLAFFFDRCFSAAAPVTSNPFSFNAAPAQSSSMFGGATATTAATPFGTTLSTTQAPSSIFGTTQPTSNVFGAATTGSPFGAKPVTAQPTFGKVRVGVEWNISWRLILGFGTATSSATPFSFGSQPAASTSIFSQPTTATPFGTTAPTSTSSIFGFPSSTAAAPTATNIFGAQPATTSIFGSTTSTAAPVFGGVTATPAFTGFGTNPATSTATNIFGAPATSIASGAPMFGGFGTQATAPTSSPFSFATTSSAPSMFGSTAPAATTSSIFNPQPFAGFGMSQPQQAATAAPTFNFSAPFGSTMASGFGAPTNLAQPQMQQQNMPQQISFVQQRFLAASLLDPFNSRGKKDFNETEQIKPPTDFIVVSNATTTTTAATSAISTPITLPLQSNARKNSGARPLVDIRFRLKPVSSSPTSNFSGEEMKSPSQPPVTSFGPIKSPLTADFSEEEEQALIGKNKLSKLRLSNDFIESSFHSDSIRSLYPMRRLAELETLANMNNNTHIISTTHTIPSSSTTIDTVSAHVSSSTVNNEQTLHPSGRSIIAELSSANFRPLPRGKPTDVAAPSFDTADWSQTAITACFSTVHHDGSIAHFSTRPVDNASAVLDEHRDDVSRKKLLRWWGLQETGSRDQVPVRYACLPHTDSHSIRVLHETADPRVEVTLRRSRRMFDQRIHRGTRDLRFGDFLRTSECGRSRSRSHQSVTITLKPTKFECASFSSSWNQSTRSDGLSRRQ